MFGRGNNVVAVGLAGATIAVLAVVFSVWLLVKFEVQNDDEVVVVPVVQATRIGPRDDSRALGVYSFADFGGKEAVRQQDVVAPSAPAGASELGLSWNDAVRPSNDADLAGLLGVVGRPLNQRSMVTSNSNRLFVPQAVFPSNPADLLPGYANCNSLRTILNQWEASVKKGDSERFQWIGVRNAIAEAALPVHTLFNCGEAIEFIDGDSAAEPFYESAVDAGETEFSSKTWQMLKPADWANLPGLRSIMNRHGDKALTMRVSALLMKVEAPFSVESMHARSIFLHLTTNNWRATIVGQPSITHAATEGASGTTEKTIHS